MKVRAKIKSTVLSILNEGNDPMRMSVKQLAQQSNVREYDIDRNLNMIAKLSSM